MELDFFTNNTQASVSSNRILYTPSSFARQSLLHLQEIGVLEARRPHTSRRSGLQSYLFFIVLTGEGRLVYKDREFVLTPGDCAFIDCSESYAHATDPDRLWTLKWCHFYGSSMPFIYNKYVERGGRSVFSPGADTVAELDETWTKLMITAGGHDYMRDMLINEQLSTLIRLIMSESWHPEERATLPSKRSVVIDIHNFIDQHYGEKITLDSLASQFFINKYYLTKSFKEQYGVSINSYLQSIRITKAKQLLRFTDKSVEEIGYESGLGAPQYFSQRFKEFEGVSPRKYREQW